jgi:hypothetical protein
MRALLILACILSTPARAAVVIDSDFWDSYEPYLQYSRETLRELAALGEGDLLETAREIDGLELRVVGRNSRASNLISARLVIDSVVRQRLQVKIVSFDLSPNTNPEPTMRRRQVTAAQADALMTLLEQQHFWDAPYSVSAPDAGSLNCSDTGHWIIEAVKPGAYQLISRMACGGLDPAAAAIRDFLLDLAGVSAAD